MTKCTVSAFSVVLSPQYIRYTAQLALLFFSMFNKKQLVRLVKTIAFPVFSGRFDLPLSFKSAS
jgi:hypothetical protein